MSGILIVEFVALAVLLACSAYCSSAESVFFSLNPLDVRRINQKSPRGADRIHRLLREPQSLLATILIGNTIVNTAASALGYTLAESFVPGHGESVAVAVMTVLLLIFGEMGPKRLGLLFASPLAVAYGPVQLALVRVATPLRLLMESVTKRFESLFRPRRPTLSVEEFQTVVEIGSEEGVLNDEEMGMIKAIVRLDDMKAADIMTPRVDIVGLNLDDMPHDPFTVAAASRVNFILLYRGNLDNVEALLDVRKFLLDKEHRMDMARTAPLFVPQSISLTRLLTQFQKDRKRFGVVVDEYGGTAGIVTRGDILEEIAGDVFEEMSKPRPVFQQTGPHRWLVDANFALDELNRKLLLHLESEEADRLSGWIVERAGHLPAANEVVESQGCRVTVMQTRRHRVTLAQVERLEAGL